MKSAEQLIPETIAPWITLRDVQEMSMKSTRKLMRKMQHDADPHKPAHGNEPPSYKAEGPPRAGKGAHKNKKKGY